MRRRDGKAESHGVEFPLAWKQDIATLRAMSPLIPIVLFGSIILTTIFFSLACLAESKGKY